MTYEIRNGSLALVPLAAAEMPRVLDGGRVFEFKLRRDIRIGDSGRILSAEDVAWSLRRLSSARATAPARELLLDAIAGLHAGAADEGAGTPRAGDGIEVIAPDILRITLRTPDYDFPHLLAMPVSSILPRGTAEPATAATGDFELVEGSAQAPRMVLQRRAQVAGSGVRRVDVLRVPDDEARYRLLVAGEIDLIERPGPELERRLTGAGRLKPEYDALGWRLFETPQLELIYYYLNMRDPVVGGDTDAQRALRRAIVQSYDVQREIREIRNGFGRPGAGPVPREIGALSDGYDLRFDPDAARADLDRAGFHVGADGWRRRPDGSELVIRFVTEPLDLVRPYAALRQRLLADIGLRSELVYASYQDNVAESERCGLGFWGSAWQGRIAAPSYFLQLAYGPNIRRRRNLACYDNPDFNRLYEQAAAIPPGQQRDTLYAAMTALLARDGVWQIGTQRVALAIARPTISRYGRRPMQASAWRDVQMHDGAVPQTPERAVEMTYLKSQPGLRAQLRQFIEANWFAMDHVAREQGLMESFRVLEGTDGSSQWDLLVIVDYRDARGYPGIAEAFERIRSQHRPRPIEGRTLRELGRIVASEMWLETRANPSHGSGHSGPAVTVPAMAH